MIFRSLHRVPPTILTRSQLYWGSLFKTQSIHSSPRKFTCPSRRQNAIWFDGMHGSGNCIWCSWIFHTCRLLLESIQWYVAEITIQMQNYSFSRTITTCKDNKLRGRIYKSHTYSPLQNGFLEVDNLTWLEPKFLQFLHINVMECLHAGICMCPELLKNLFR